MASFQEQKIALIRGLLESRPRINERDLEKKGTVLGGALTMFYDRLERINQGNKFLSDRYGGGLLAPNYEIVQELVRYRPGLDQAEISNLERKQDGLFTVHWSSYEMGFDQVSYWTVNAPGTILSKQRKALNELNNEVKTRPRASILDIARDDAPKGALTHMYEILNRLVDDFEQVTLNAPVIPPASVLAPLF